MEESKVNEVSITKQTKSTKKQPKEPKQNKWDDPEFKRQYFKEYYHKKKELVGRYTGWTKDQEKVKEYRKEYYSTRGNEEEECPVCKVMVKRKYMSYHNLHSKIHKLLVSRL